MKTAEEYLNQYHDSKWFLHDLIRAILSDAQAEIDALKASQLQPIPEIFPETDVVFKAKERRSKLSIFTKDGERNLTEEEKQIAITSYLKGAEYIHRMYLQRYGTPWWAKLKEGDEISWLGRIKTFKRNRLEMSDGCIHLIDDCRPYTGPTADEVIAEIGEEKYEVLKKKWQQEAYPNSNHT